MSVLMLIKYPISNPPTIEQLKALPPGLYNQWVDEALCWHSEAKAMHELFGPTLICNAMELLHKCGNKDGAAYQRIYQSLFNLVYNLDEE